MEAKIPHKISPDRILDAIVCFRIELRVPYSYFLTDFSRALPDTFRLEEKGSGPFWKLNDSFGARIQSHDLLYDDEISIEVSEGQVLLNCIEDYISWEKYLPKIVQVVRILQNLNFLQIYSIGLRYVSRYEGLSMSDNLKLKVVRPWSEDGSWQYRMHFERKRFDIILNLLMDSYDENVEGNLVSLIDIDVICEIEDGQQEKVLEVVENAHEIEKEIFFSLLEPQFLATLNPVYK